MERGCMHIHGDNDVEEIRVEFANFFSRARENARVHFP